MHDEDNFTVYTPADIANEHQDVLPDKASRENVNLMLMHDDTTYLDFLI